MSVEFMIRYDDVAKFLEEAEKDKAQEGKEWIVHITVRGNIGSFLAGSTAFKCQLYSTNDGKVKMPISCLAKVAHWGWVGYFSENEPTELTPAVRPACYFVDGAALVKMVEARVSVGLQSALEVLPSRLEPPLPPQITGNLICVGPAVNPL